MRNHTELPAKRDRAALRRGEDPLTIHSFNKYLLVTYYIPGMVLEARGYNTEKDGQGPCSQGADILMGRQ